MFGRLYHRYVDGVALQERSGCIVSGSPLAVIASAMRPCRVSVAVLPGRVVSAAGYIALVTTSPSVAINLLTAALYK